MKKIAIIGASYLQEPLIRKVKEMGYESHVFAWKCGDIGERIADFFYPISIVEKEEILEKCKEIKIDGICTIASDLASITVNYVAVHLGLIGNSIECTQMSTNKHLMRECFRKNQDPSCHSRLVSSIDDLDLNELNFPLIVKPVDRSGSRGIHKIYRLEDLQAAIENAKETSFEKKALVEDYIDGDEYSVECITWQGKHTFLTMTKKYTTGAPNFIETAHLEPTDVSQDVEEKVKHIVFHALSSLKIEYGASHSEVKINNKGQIRIIEIGARMGGDFIGSHLVQLSTGFDFVKGVIDVCLNQKPDIQLHKEKQAAVRFIFTNEDIDVLNELEKNPKINVIQKEIHPITETKVVDSSTRFGYFLFMGECLDEIKRYMPQKGE